MLRTLVIASLLVPAAALAQGKPGPHAQLYLYKGADRDPKDVLADAIERGRAYLDAGAATVFVPGLLDEPTVAALVDALGPQKVTLIGIPGSLPLDVVQRLGVARVSYGPWSQNVALTALADLTSSVLAGGALPEGTRRLN